MRHQPPKGVRPPQFEGRRTGRPKGSRNFAKAWREVQWAFGHRFDDRADIPSGAAGVWWYFAHFYPDELEEFLERYGML